MINFFNNKYLPYEMISKLVNYYEKVDIFLNESNEYKKIKKEILSEYKISLKQFGNFITKTRTNKYTDFRQYNFKGLVKKVVNLKAIDKEIYFKKALYIKPNLWSKEAYNDFYTSIEGIKKEYLIIDLRDSTGGYLDQCLDICNLLMPKCEIVSLEYKRKKVIHYSDSKNHEFKKIFVIVNKNTASSSEILAYSLYTNLKNVLLFGDKTFGKTFGQDRIVNKKYNFCFTVPSFFWHIKNFTFDNISIVPIKTSFLSELESLIN